MDYFSLSLKSDCADVIQEEFFVTFENVFNFFLNTERKRINPVKCVPSSVTFD